MGKHLPHSPLLGQVRRSDIEMMRPVLCFLLAIVMAGCATSPTAAVAPTDRVVVRYTVNERGEVEEARAVSSTNPDFEAAAVAAVKDWRFPSRSKGGKVTAEQEILFQPDAPDASPATGGQAK